MGMWLLSPKYCAGCPLTKSAVFISWQHYCWLTVVDDNISALLLGDIIWCMLCARYAIGWALMDQFSSNTWLRLKPRVRADDFLCCSVRNRRRCCRANSKSRVFHTGSNQLKINITTKTISNWLTQNNSRRWQWPSVVQNFTLNLICN